MFFHQVGLQYDYLFGHKPPPATAKSVIDNLKTTIVQQESKLQYNDLFGHQPPPATAKSVIVNLKTTIVQQ